MSRQRLYGSDAERQKAYRERLATGAVSIAAPRRPPRPPSRPARLQALCTGAELLREEYQGWLESLPEALQEGEQAARLTDTIEVLEQVVELLSGLEPPRGFGRD